jgi:hypothetical protein
MVSVRPLEICAASVRLQELWIGYMSTAPEFHGVAVGTAAADVGVPEEDADSCRPTRGLAKADVAPRRRRERLRGDIARVWNMT